jgi:hypothetical protein
MAKRILPPKLVEHGQKVKAAHAHLTANQPGFKALPMPHKMRAVQAHIKRGGYC